MEKSQASWIEREQLLIDFDQRWGSGNPPEIESYISRYGGNSTAALLIELIKIDLEHQWKSGHVVHIEHYLDRFDQLAVDPESRWQLVTGELSARAIVDQLPDKQEVKQRFPHDSQRVSDLIVTLTRDKKVRSTPNDSTHKTADDINKTVVSGSENGTAPRGKELVAGDVISHYRLIKQIGKGTFSTVWSASDDGLQRKVAIKILNPDRLTDPNIVRRMMREARAAAQLEHPSIIQVYEVGQHRSLPFIVTQLIEGMTLQAHLAKHEYTVDESARVIRDIAAGIHFAHCDGVVHRDIKPANILMANRMKPMIADFGLAFYTTQPEITLTLAGDILGTPAYMSPEQAEGNVHLTDPRTDVYSVGVLLYQMLTGSLPFEGSMSSVMHKVIHGSAPSPKSLKSSIPRDLETITMKCLEKSPQDRYFTAQELADDLERYLDRAPIKARPVGVLERTFRWSRKRPRIAALIAVTIMLSGFLVGSLIQLNTVITQKETTQVLLAETESTAGRLAMQRGRMKLAVDHFEKSKSLGGMTNFSDKLHLVEALIGTRNTAQARKYVSSLADAPAKTESEQASVYFWQAVLALEQGSLSQAIELFEQANTEALNDSDREFAKAMLADSTPKVIRRLQRAVDRDPLSHHARRMLLWMLFSLSDFEELQKQLRLADHLFPGDQDFAILRSVLLSCQDNMEKSERTLADCGLDAEDFLLWRKTCFTLNQIIHKSTHTEGLAGFDRNRLKLIFRGIVDDIWPALQSRGLYFPPRISEEFVDFRDAMILMVRNDTQNIESLSAIVDVHPEPSLVLLLAAQHMAATNIETAMALAEKALRYDGFVSDTRQVAIESVAACAVYLVTLNKRKETETEPELYHKFVNAVEMFETEPELIKKYSQQQFGTPIIIGLIEALTMHYCNQDIILRWLSRMEAAGQATRNDILWIKTIVAMRTENWYRVVELCDAQLELVDQTDVMMKKDSIESARNKAIAKFQQLDLEENENQELKDE